MNHNYLSIIVSSDKKGISEKHWTQLDLQHYQIYEQREAQQFLIYESTNENSKSVFNHTTLYLPAKSDGILSLTTNALRKTIKDNIENSPIENIIFSFEERLEIWANKEEWVQIFKSIKRPVYERTSVHIDDLFIPISELVRVLEYSIETGRDFNDFIIEEKLRLEPYGKLICEVLSP